MVLNAPITLRGPLACRCRSVWPCGYRVNEQAVAMSKISKSYFSYPGDAALNRLLQRCHCTTPVHVIRMRFWGEIVSPSFSASPLKSINALWTYDRPTFSAPVEANVLFRSLAGLWNDVARYQSGSLPLRLQNVETLDSREALRLTTNLRIEELCDGFLHGFTGGNWQIAVPSSIYMLLTEINEALEVFATMEGMFAKTLGPHDTEWFGEFREMIPEVDRIVEHHLNAIATCTIRLRMHHICGLSGSEMSSREPNVSC